MSRIRLVLLSVVVLVAILLTALFAFDLNWLRGYVERQVTERSGRTLSIRGDLDLEFSLPLRVRMERVHLTNAPWAVQEEMLDIEAAEFSIKLLPLLRGKIVLPDVALTKPRVALEWSKDGERNWILSTEQLPEDEGPRIGRLTIDEGTIRYRDPRIDTDIQVAFKHDSGAAEPTRALGFDAQGRFKGLKFAASGFGGSVLSIRDETLPYPLQADVQVGDTRASAEGTITGLVDLAGLNVGVDLRGADMAKLYPLIGVVIPQTPPYRIAGHAVLSGKTWTFSKFLGKVGDSDLSGDFAVDMSGARPKLTGDLNSRVLDVDDLAGFIGAPPKTGRGETASPAQKEAAAKIDQGQRVLPDKEFDLGKLRTMDADVKLSAASIRHEGLPLDHLEVHLLLNDGLLKLTPLNFGTADGKIVSDITLDGRGKKITGEAAIKFDKLQLYRLIPKLETSKTSVGTLSGRAKLSWEGNSFARMLGSANGELALATAGGKISNLLLEIAGLDGAEIIKFLFGGDKNVQLRCGVAQFKVVAGQMNSQVFVIDTDDTNVTGEGSINLANETLNVTLYPLPKDKSFLSARSPVDVTGTFKDPSVTPDAKALALRGGAAVLLAALVHPLAALIPLIETGPGKDSDCRGLIAAATRAINRQAAQAGAAK
jgi:uncharacterized protein involved in outer membrane biogenesis